MPRSRQAALIAFALTAVAVGAAMTPSAPSHRGLTTPAQAVHAAQAARSPVTVTLDSGTVE